MIFLYCGDNMDKIKNIEYDKNRTLFLENKGYKVIRFWNNEIDNNIEGVYKTILDYIESLD